MFLLVEKGLFGNYSSILKICVMCTHIHSICLFVFFIEEEVSSEFVHILDFFLYMFRIIV